MRKTFIAWLAFIIIASIIVNNHQYSKIRSLEKTVMVQGDLMISQSLLIDAMAKKIRTSLPYITQSKVFYTQ